MAHPYSRGAHPKWLGREKLADGGEVDDATRGRGIDTLRTAMNKTEIQRQRDSALGRIVQPPHSGLSRKNGDAMDFDPNKWLAPNIYRLPENI